MTISLLCAIRGHKRPETRDSILIEAMRVVAGDWGGAMDISMRRLDLTVAARAWVDLTGVKALYVGKTLYGKTVNELWHTVKDREFMAGRGYEPWVWHSVRQYLRICGEGGRTLKVVME